MEKLLTEKKQQQVIEEELLEKKMFEDKLPQKDYFHQLCFALTLQTGIGSLPPQIYTFEYISSPKFINFNRFNNNTPME